MVKRCLISWLGKTDLKGIENSTELGTRGPLCTILETYTLDKSFSKVHIFYAIDEQFSENSLKIIQNKLHKISPCIFHSLDIADPSDLELVYTKLLHELKKLKTDLEEYDVYYNLSSGTPAMYSVSLLFNSQHIVGKTSKALRTIEKKFAKSDGRQVFEVSLPSDLANIRIDTIKENTWHKDIFVADINKKIFDQVYYKVAKTKASILVLGETGVGKSHLAKFIHDSSDRKDRQFFSINCAEIAGSHDLMRSELFGHKKGSFTGAINDKKGCFELADSSTLFLDEIGEVPLALQGMLLRAVENGEIQPLGDAKAKKVNVRIIAATNKDLEKCIQEGTFRQDLYYRLAQYTPRLSPIREYSREDLSSLLHNLLNKINLINHKDYPRILSKEAETLLLKAHWTGNIREMQHVLVRICLLSEMVITKEDILAQLLVSKKSDVLDNNEEFIPQDLKSYLIEKEKSIIVRAIQKNKNISEVAKALSLPLTTLRSKMQKLEIRL